MNLIRIIKFSILSISILCCGTVFAQKQSNIWYFGSKAGLDFNHTPVQALNNGVMDTWEGSASIADANGALLFYTDGTTIWNRNHLIMDNGNYLTGNASSTQSGVIVPVPTHPDLYYVFTVGAQGGSLDYSIVDITKDAGFGAVTTKNVRLIPLSTEKITAVKHANGRDIWVIGHELNNNKFHTWLITPTGIDPAPIITSIGSDHSGGGNGVAAIGYMKASPDGNHIALGAMEAGIGFAETFDFDNQTGLLSNPKKLTGFSGQTVYGIEFSPDGNFLYILEEGGSGRLFQIPVPFNSGTAVQRGKLIASALNWGGLQLAPDGRILITQNNDNKLDAITFPSLEGAACGYVKNAVSLGNGIAHGGLPTFIQSFFSAFSFNISNICLESTTEFLLVSSEANYDEISWNFGDPSSGLANKSSLRNPKHLYQQPGDYEVTLTVKKGLNTSTITQSFTIHPLPVVKLPADLKLFYGERTVLNAGGTENTYLWNTGSTSAALTVTSPGTYSVTATNRGGCTASDEIKITYDQIITSGLSKEALLCRGTSITLDVTLPGASYLWSDGSTGPTLKVSAAGRYSVTITNAYNNRRRTDEIEIKYIDFSPLILPVRTVICAPGSATITASGAGPGQFYNWYNKDKVFIEQNNGVFHTPHLDESSKFYALITDGSCSGDMEETFVQIDRPYAKIIAIDSVINVGETITLVGNGGVGYAWNGDAIQTSATEKVITAQPLRSTVYRLTTTNENGCIAETTINITVNNNFNIPNTFTPNGDGVNDIWIIPYITYLPTSINIYNRYGQKIYLSTNYSNNWDGTTNGRPLPFGTYYYVMVVDNKTTITGNISILR